MSKETHLLTRRFAFDYGHRLLNHEGKCRHLHGHRGVAEVTLTAKHLDDIGRVIDFGEVKGIIGKWIDEAWDHNVILHENDPLVALLRSPNLSTGRLPYTMSANPTAENLAEELHLAAARLLPPHIAILSVGIWETPNCSAFYVPVPSSEE